MLVFATSQIRYYIPEYGVSGRDFPAVSITGSYCALKCKHCYGRILERMIPASTPERLVEVCRRLAGEGAKGVLISGGSNPAGEVPFERFASALKEVKKMGLKVYMHTGIVDEERARLLKECGVDMALYDVVSSDRAAVEIMGLEGASRFLEGLRALLEAGVEVAPHVVVGLGGEREAVDFVADSGCRGAVLVVFTPYPGTPMESALPPPPSEVVSILEYARSRIAGPLSLGCMRPRGPEYSHVERAAVDLELEGIAFPSKDALDYLAERGGFEVVHECCASVLSLARR